MNAADTQAIAELVVAAGVVIGGVIWIIRSLAYTEAQKVQKEIQHPINLSIEARLNDLLGGIRSHVLDTSEAHRPGKESREQEQYKGAVIGIAAAVILWWLLKQQAKSSPPEEGVDNGNA